MEESDDFKLAVKVVIKRQMKDLMEQLRERGEEIAVLTVDLEDNSYSHFGSPNGEWFLSQQKNIPQSFLSFCQSNTNQVASQTTVTAVSPKKKSIASLRSASKQNTSTEVPEVRVTVPKKLAGDLSEEEVAALVGRIVATHLAFQEKGDGSSSGTQFDVLLKTANQSKHKGNSSIFATPRSARKRKPTAKFMEGMSSLKKGRKIDDEETNEMEVGNEEMFGLLSELSNTVLRRVKVTVPNNKTINLEKSSLDTSETTEALAVYIIQELDAVCGSQLANRNSIKVEVHITNSNRKSLSVKLLDLTSDDKRHEFLDDSDMEYLDEEDDYDDYIDDNNEDDDNDEEEDNNKSDFKNIQTDEVNQVNLQDIKIEKSVDAFTETMESPEKSRRQQSGVKRRPKPCETIPKQCPHCDSILIGVSGLSAHIRRVHLKVRNYACNICDMTFFSSTHKSDHFNAIHTMKCTVCNHGVCEKEPWTEDMDASSIRVVKCTNCNTDNEFRNKYVRGRQKPGEDDDAKSKRRNRKRALSEITPMECEQCGVVLKGRSSLKAHIKRMHLMTRNHVCGVCTKGFYSKTHLESHMLSLHARRCQVCQEYVMESEPWGPDVDRWSERNLTCSCGASVTIVTKLGRKPEVEEEDYQPKKRPKKESNPDARYVCGTCGKIFMKKKNAMNHACSSKEGDLDQNKTQSCELCKLKFESDEALNDHLTKEHSEQTTEAGSFTVQTTEAGVFTVESEGVIIDNENQVVMFEDAETHTAISELTEGSQLQVMHDGKLVPVEQVVGPDGNVVSFIIKE
ncbi:hypothetical protein ACF0H5_001053 [Mactra antiquata]